MPTRRIMVRNENARPDAEPIDGQNEVHGEDIDMFTGLSHTKFDEPNSFGAEEPILDLTNIDADWNA